MVDAAAVILWFAVTAYVVFGGTAYGAGFWALLCPLGEKGDRRRALIRHAVGPVWEAGHVWLLLALLVSWTAFPDAFDAVRSTMAVPLALASIAIVLRLAAYALAGSGASSPALARAWSRVWSATSVVTPFLLGAVLGGVASGRVAVGAGGDGGSLEAWVNPTSMVVGLVAVALAAFEGAIHLASEACRFDDVRLEHSVRHRGVQAAAVAGALALIGVFVLGGDSPYMRHGLTHEGLPLVVVAIVGGVTAVATLRLGAGRRTRLLTGGAVTALVWAWGLAQYPFAIPETLTLEQAAANHDRVTSTAVAFGLVSAALVVVLALLHVLDQRGRTEAGASPIGGGTRHRVVIVGGGFGGLAAAQLLGYRPVDVVLVDRRNHHLFQPLLYQVATGILSPGQIAAPLRHVLRRHKNVTVEMAEVAGFDLESRVVHAKRFFQTPMDVPYDSLIVAAGAGQSYFGHDEFSLYAPGMKTIDDALEIRRRVLGALEMAETSVDAQERDTWMTMVIVGAGPTGVELAGQIREMAVRSLKDDFRRIDPTKVRVVLVDGAAEPLATFGDELSAKAARTLERMGVELMMGARVTAVDGTGVDVSFKDESGTVVSSHITSHTVIWAAGVQASPLGTMLAEATGAELDRAGRISVLPDLTLPGHPEVFVVGDMISLNHLPGVAEVAMQGGLHAANSVLRRLRGESETETLPFRYRDLGSLATIGRFRAVMSFGKLRLSGFPAWAAWCFVHLAFLTSFGNRFTTILRWAGAMIGHGRSERSFSVGRTAGDVSMPDTVRAAILPARFPVVSGAGAGDLEQTP